MSYSDHFSINNIPYGIASDATRHTEPSVATRIHDQIVYLQDLDIDIAPEVKETFTHSTLNALAATPKPLLLTLRTALQSLLSNPDTLSRHGIPAASAQLHLPIATSGFTDFSCSHEHLLNAREATAGVRELPPAGPYFPIGYNGRASSVRVSGTPVTRPWGQYYDNNGAVVFGPSRAFDFELEMAAVVGRPSTLGQRVRIEDADDHIFGLVLLNDWSARDIQKLEMNPLGPINGKSTLTSISPWVVTLEALAPFAVAAPHKTAEAPVAPYLQDPKPNPSYRITLEVDVVRNNTTTRVCTAQLGWMYWTFRDLVAQQTVNGCDIRTGDLLATGTVSGVGDDEHGCLLEMVVVRKKRAQDAPPPKDEILWLEDGDETRFVGYCGEGVGFGECVGVLKPAIPF